ncbi:AfsR/SARP family transcriptional regulator [Paractinoplanes lichenicola]|uniref:Tetratricopeptide repeat protein n=1 Tax=Paractinoplanes lichenicola TaxID=2802976 RepID=A0ABS1VES9_9ACTN|nr:BTAD domain-containing putative transcriptional regulator [Actinoplanes lichenicola]MBL7253138.1 tetratricopeptide repeat protein [Actinoplanes lichenicola]
MILPVRTPLPPARTVAVVDASQRREGATMAVDFALLGPVRARVDGRLVPLPPGRLPTVLAALLLARGRVSTERLMGALWDEPPASAVPNLRTYVAQLRRLLGPHADRLTRSGDGYTLRVEAGELDLHVWEQSLADARRAAGDGNPAEAADLLAAGLARWTGAAAEGVPRRGATGRGLHLLDEARWGAVERHARACIDAGRPGQAVEGLRALVAEQPARETAWQHLVLALARDGDRAAALVACSEARQALVSELGVEPGPVLRDLQARLLRGPRREAPAGAAAPVVRTLPPDPEIVGRDELIEAVTGAEPGTVVALHGPAGAGKSALAVRAAWALAPAHPDGQLHLDMCGSSPGLTPMTTGDALASLLQALGVAAAGSAAEQLTALGTAVRGRRVVVVLDNVVDAAQVRRLLTGLTGATVLITSRSMLSTLDVRRQVAVGELSPAAAVSLLAHLSGRPRVAAAPDDARTLAGLCDHLPLALRIVGARLAGRPDWPLAAMVTRLADERHRLDELAADDLAVRAGLSLTCRALRHRAGGAEALHLFDAWGAVGAPVMSLGLARAVTGADAHEARAALDRLAEVRLIEPVAEDRYRIHDLVRIYAMERAAGHPSDALHRARCYYLGTARRARDLLRSNLHRQPDDFAEKTPTVELADDQDALRWFESERVNLRDLIHRCAREATTEGDRFAARLVVELYPFLPMRGYYTDWHDLAEAALAGARRLGSPPDETAVLIQLAGALSRAGQHPEAIGTLRAAPAVTEAPMTALVLDHLAVALTHGGRLAEAKECFGRCVELHRAGGQRSSLGITLNNLADLHRQLGEYSDALRHLTESLALRRELGDRLGAGITTLTIGQVYAEDGRAGEAVAWLTDALDLARSTGNTESEWRALTVRARLSREAGRLHEARADLADALRLSEAAGDEQGAAEVRQSLLDSQ